jgi:hypothetical protein
MEVLALIRTAHEAGLTITAEGGTLIVRGPKCAAPVVRQLADVKADVLAALARSEQSDIARWYDRFAARIAHRSLNGQRSWREAERLAFGDMILEWHRRHGARPDPRSCAACGHELPDGSGIVLDHGGLRVHFDAVRRDDCIIAYGQKWRGAAIAALQKLGINPPEGFEPS